MMRKSMLVLVLLLAVFIRFGDFTHPPIDTHHVRQADTASIVRNMQRSGIELLTPKIDWGGPEPVTVESELPLYNALVTTLLGETPIDSPVGYHRTRFMSLGIWLIMVWVTYRWVGYFWPQLQLGVLLFLCLSPLSVVFSTTIQPDMLAVCLMMLAFERMATSQHQHCRGLVAVMNGVLANVAWSLAIMVKGTMIFALPGMILSLQHVESPRRKWVWWIGMGLSTVIALGWYTHAYFSLGETGATFGIWSEAGEKWGTWRVLSDIQTWRQIFQAMLFCLWTPLGAALLGVGVWMALTTPSLRQPLWSLIGSVIGVVLVADGFRHHEYYLLLLMPWGSVFASQGLVTLGQWYQHQGGNHRTLLSLVGCCLLSYSVLTGWAYVVDARRLDDRVLEAARMLQEHTTTESTVLVVDRHAQTILYLADRRGWCHNAFNIDGVNQLIHDGVETVAIFEPSNGVRDVATLSTSYRLIQAEGGTIIEAIQRDGF